MKHIYKTFKRAFVVGLLSFTALQLRAQTDMQISYFMNNEMAFNPSFAGANEGGQVSLLGRQQWIAFDKAPMTQTLHGDIKTKFGGVGLYVINDRLGYESSVLAKATYAYHIKTGEHTSLSVGVALGGYSKGLDGDKLIYQDETQTDPNGIYQDQHKLKPTLDVGLHLSHKNLNVGLSATHVNQGIFKSDFYNIPRHYYGYIQYEWDINNKISLVPTLYTKSNSYIIQAEVNCNVFYNDRFWAGATYRLNESAAILAGVIIKKRFKIGYAYDFSVGAIHPHSNGNHEIIMSFRFGGELKKPEQIFYQSTRLFN